MPTGLSTPRRLLFVGTIFVSMSCSSPGVETPEAEPIGLELESTPVVVRQPPPPPVTIEGEDAADDSIREASFGAGVLAVTGDCLHRVDPESGRPLDIPVFPPDKTTWFSDDNIVELRGVTASLGDVVIMGGGELVHPLLHQRNDCPAVPMVSVDTMRVTTP